MSDWRERRKELIIPCDCGCTHGVFSHWSDDEDPEIMLSHYTTCGYPTFWHRVATAWKVVWGMDHYIHTVLIHKENAEKLRDYLNGFLSDA